MNTKLFIQGMAMTTMLVSSQFSSAITFNLCAGTTTLTMPDATTVTMWGYGIDDFTPNCASASVPGPQLDVPVGDNQLSIALRNTLSEPTSIIVPGLANTFSPTPVFFTDSQGRQRARAMTNEAAPGSIATYNFTATPGTYLYHSGSHPAVQVQMGLYGGATQDASLGEVYSGVPYDNEVVLLYSEIDPALHDAVQNSTYGTPAYPTTISYKPRYFLINGAPYTAAASDIYAGSTDQTTLLRFLNAGLESHVPVIQSGNLEILAEYGSQYPYPRLQNSFLLAAGQTKDILFKPETAERYALFDRRLRLTNNLQSNGGLMSFLNVTAAATDPVATIDLASTSEDTPLTALDLASNDTDSDGIDLDSIHIPFQPDNGSVVANNDTTGTVTYTPNSNFNGVDTFSYSIRDNMGNVSSLTDVTVTVNPVNDAPVAADETYNIVAGSSLSIAAPGILTNDSDVDLDTLTAQLETSVSGGTLILNADGSFNYTPNAGTNIDTFTYKVLDTSSALSNLATVTININSIPSVTVVSPSGDIGTNNLPTYVWNAIPSATNYKLWTKNSAGVISQVWYTPADVNCANGETMCSFATTTALANGTHSWRVRARNIAGLGPWSSALSFIIGSVPPAPTLNAPAGSIGLSSSPTFEWNSIAGATNYKLWVRDPAGVVTQSWYTPTQANCANGEAICSIISPTVLANGSHDWKMRARNSVGLGPWSGRVIFYIGAAPSTPVLISPVGNTAINLPIYAWNSVAETVFYQIKVRNSAGVVVTNLQYTAAQAGCANGEATCSVTPNISLASPDTYRWEVKAKNNAGQSPWSSRLTFDIQ